MFPSRPGPGHLLTSVPAPRNVCLGAFAHLSPSPRSKFRLLLPRPSPPAEVASEASECLPLLTCGPWQPCARSGSQFPLGSLGSDKVDVPAVWSCALPISSSRPFSKLVSLRAPPGRKAGTRCFSSSGPGPRSFPCQARQASAAAVQVPGPRGSSQGHERESNCGSRGRVRDALSGRGGTGGHAERGLDRLTSQRHCQDSGCDRKSQSSAGQRVAQTIGQGRGGGPTRGRGLGWRLKRIHRAQT